MTSDYYIRVLLICVIGWGLLSPQSIYASGTHPVKLYDDIRIEGLVERDSVSTTKLKGLEKTRLKYGRYDVSLELTHPDNESKTTTVTSCAQFEKLLSNDWYARTSLAMGAQTKVERQCQIVDKLRQMRNYRSNFIDTSPEDWWKVISTAVIKTAHRASILKRLRKDKPGYENRVKQAETLGDLGSSDSQSVTIEINRFPDQLAGETVTVIDEFDISRIALGDFNEDGIAELMVKTKRIPRTQSEDNYRRYFGTVHGIGSGNIQILQKDSPEIKSTPLKRKETSNEEY